MAQEIGCEAKSGSEVRIQRETDQKYVCNVNQKQIRNMSVMQTLSSPENGRIRKQPKSVKRSKMTLGDRVIQEQTEISGRGIKMAKMIEITDFDAPELDVYARLTENQLINRHEPEKGMFIAESPKVIERALGAGYMPVSILTEKRHIEGEGQKILARCGEIPVYTAEFDVLTKLTGFQLTRGMLCAMRRQPLPSVRSVCKGAKRIAVLENVVNPTNVGAIFRSAAALGMDAVLLTTGCSNPLYRRAIRVSMGTVFQVPWTYLGEETKPETVRKIDPEAEKEPGIGIDWNSELEEEKKPGTGTERKPDLEEEKEPETEIERNSEPEEKADSGNWQKQLHELGFHTVAMALKEDSLRIDDPKLMNADKLAIVLGTEGDGLAPETIAACDDTVCIPMAHGVDSLNVAAASAVAFWQLGRQAYKEKEEK